MVVLPISWWRLPSFRPADFDEELAAVSERVGGGDGRLFVVERDGRRFVQAFAPPLGSCLFHPASPRVYEDFSEQVVFFVRRLTTSSDCEELDALNRGGNV